MKDIAMNEQETFNKVRDHLLKQKCKARDNERVCMYRAPDGKMCAVGCLIPDELYKEGMEGRTFDMLMEGFPELESIFPLERSFYAELQYIHDDSCSDEWEKLLRSFAERRGLIYGMP